MLWVKTSGESRTPWPNDLQEEEQGVKDREPNATSQVKDSKPLVPTPIENLKRKQVHFQLLEESFLNKGIPPLLEEVNPPHTTIIDDVSNDEADEKIVVESP